MRLLFVKHSLAWPRSSGHDVHTFHMMKACADLGHDVSLATVVQPEPPAIEGARLREVVKLDAPADGPPLPGTRLQHKFRSFWGVEDDWVRSLRAAAARLRSDAVIVGGLDALPFLPPLERTIRVWYAADEWVLHHLSILRFRRGDFADNLKAAAMKGLYERAHRRVLDRVWVVTERDRTAMRRIAGVTHVDVLPNGVDAEFFKPGPEPIEPKTAVFWGRLDFGPNIQALEWFCGKVWPLIRQAEPEGRFRIIGFQPTDPVRAMASAPGMTLEPNLRDLRSTARQQSVAVLPLISGAGIKNKLLEAAAMGLPIVCTPLATLGLRGDAPVTVADTPRAFADAVVAAWRAPGERAARGRAVRDWVVRDHSWRATAELALQALASHPRVTGR